MIRQGRAQGHYYVLLLGLRNYEPLRLNQSIRRGLTYSAFERFQRNTELPSSLLSEVAQISARTLARRKEQGRLDPEESDRLVRASRIFARALELFEGEPEEARRWLTTPQPGLGRKVPLELAATDVGAREVENLIGRLEHGIPT